MDPREKVDSLCLGFIFKHNNPENESLCADKATSKTQKQVLVSQEITLGVLGDHRRQSGI